MRVHRSIWIAVAIAVLAAACSHSASNHGAQPTTAATSASTVVAPVTAAATSSATAFAGTPSPLRTPNGPHDTACFEVTNPGPPTAVELARLHGAAVSCDLFGRRLFVGVPGSAADARPGFATCAQPPTATDDYCGVGLAPTIDRSQLIDHWQFLPAPAADAKEVGAAAGPQQYQCVGNAAQLWAFHFDTLTYTAGCTPPPSFINGMTPCDAFLYVGLGTSPDLYATYGKPAGCQQLGENTLVGILDGAPQPGVAVCGPIIPADQIWNQCGLDTADHVNLGVWHFTPLPVASGPVDSATFDTAAGTACITVGAQSFTFTVATSAVTSGCAGAPPATATP